MENYEDSDKIPQPLNFITFSEDSSHEYHCNDTECWVRSFDFITSFRDYWEVELLSTILYSSLCLFPHDFTVPLIRGWYTIIPHLRLSSANWMLENITRAKTWNVLCTLGCFLHFCHGHAKNMFQLVPWSQNDERHMG